MKKLLTENFFYYEHIKNGLLLRLIQEISDRKRYIFKPLKFFARN